MTLKPIPWQFYAVWGSILALAAIGALTVLYVILVPFKDWLPK